jgi:glutathione synthase/RimK-type ligase-like ATP-grasp enzyme
MTDIAVLTPNPADPSYAGQWPGVLERLSEALGTAGVRAVPTPWTDHVENASALSAFPLVLPLIAWGYHRDHERWLSACRTWAEARAPLANPASVLTWNSDKHYLARLSDAGVPIPPTLFVEQASDEAVATAFAETGAERLVVKPTVSGGAWKTLRLAPGETLADPPTGSAMIQPYLPSIESEGETSLLFFGGRLSHAVNKRPVPGDFRIQVQFGGIYTPVEPNPAALAVADKVFAAVDEALLYARIDLARGPSGDWLLMEAELIEPDFYLGHAADGGGAFAQAVRGRLG